MQIVIEIPDRIYESVQDGTYCGTLYKELKNGTPLPKGHGRLIDADAMSNRLYTSEASDFFGVVTCAEIADFIDDEKPIIEADKAESEDKG